MVFKCKDKEKDVTPVEVSIEEDVDDGDVNLYLDNILVAYFDSIAGNLTRLSLTQDEIEKFRRKGVAIDGCFIEITK